MGQTSRWHPSACLGFTPVFIMATFSLSPHCYILVNANPAYWFLLADKRFASCSLVSGSLLPVLLSWSCDIFTPVPSRLTVTSLTVGLKFFFTAPGIFLSSAEVVRYGQPVLCLFQSLALGTFSFRSSHTAVLYILLWFCVFFVFRRVFLSVRFLVVLYAFGFSCKRMKRWTEWRLSSSRL